MTTKSGWCLTNYCEQCPRDFSFGRCPCDCHIDVIEALASAVKDRADLAAHVIVTLHTQG